MMLCYKCYMKKYKDDKWDDYPCNETKDKCEDCGLIGIFVREIKEV